jgi:hypothetical protein
MDAKKIQELISAYGLFEVLEARANTAILDGVARSTIYAAFNRNKSPREKLIVELAAQIVLEHESNVEKAVADMAAAKNTPVPATLN